MSILFAVKEIREVRSTKEVNELLNEDWQLLETYCTGKEVVYVIGKIPHGVCQPQDKCHS